MINLEQVKLLETKVVKAIDYVDRLTKENNALRRQEAELQAKLESYQKRIDELEVLVMRFKDDQGQIESGILAALDKLNQFEKAMEKGLKNAKSAVKEPAKVQEATPSEGPADDPGDGQACFEIPEAADPGSNDAGSADEDDLPDPLENTSDTEAPANAGSSPAEGRELDIF